MSIYPVATQSANSTTSSGSTAANSSTDTTTTFMKLLATELQSQDPTQTMDPTTMVTQMVQINQLNDVSGIYSLLQNQLGGTTGSTPSNHAVHNSQGGN
jgi:flagellar basal-body rod modification protein FlgD